MYHDEENDCSPRLNTSHDILDVAVLKMSGPLNQIEVETELPVIEVVPQLELAMVELIDALLQLLDLWLHIIQALIDVVFNLLL
jgi:hypothetical protein